jgi:hypothetical protein
MRSVLHVLIINKGTPWHAQQQQASEPAGEGAHEKCAAP